MTADDIKSWLSSENLVADAVKVIRNPETQESKGFAFIESPNQEEMNAIIRRSDRAPLEEDYSALIPPNPPKSGKSAGKSAIPADRGKRPATATGNNLQRKSAHGRRPSARRDKALLQRNWLRLSKPEAQSSLPTLLPHSLPRDVL